MINTRLIVSLLLLLVGCLTEARPAKAFMEKVGKESVDHALDQLKSMQDQLVSSVFDKANKTIDNLISQASTERKSALIQAGSELQYAIASLTAQFGSETKGTISRANAELQNDLAVLIASYRRKLVTAGIGKAAYRGGA